MLDMTLLWYTTDVTELCVLDVTCTMVHNRGDRAVCWTRLALWYTTDVTELCVLDMTCTIVHNRRDRNVCVLDLTCTMVHNRRDRAVCVGHDLYYGTQQM